MITSGSLHFADPYNPDYEPACPVCEDVGFVPVTYRGVIDRDERGRVMVDVCPAGCVASPEHPGYRERVSSGFTSRRGP